MDLRVSTYTSQKDSYAFCKKSVSSKKGLTERVMVFHSRKGHSTSADEVLFRVILVDT